MNAAKYFIALLLLFITASCATRKYPPVKQYYSHPLDASPKLKKALQTQEALSALNEGLGEFRYVSRRYPTKAEGLTVLLNTNPKTKRTYIRPEYLKDSWGNPIQYFSSKKWTGVFTFGPDGIPNTRDELCVMGASQNQFFEPPSDQRIPAGLQ